MHVIPPYNSVLKDGLICSVAQNERIGLPWKLNSSYRYLRLFESSTYLQYDDIWRKDDKFAFQFA